MWKQWRIYHRGQDGETIPDSFCKQSVTTDLRSGCEYPGLELICLESGFASGKPLAASIFAQQRLIPSGASQSCVSKITGSPQILGNYHLGTQRLLWETMNKRVRRLDPQHRVSQQCLLGLRDLSQLLGMPFRFSFTNYWDLVFLSSSVYLHEITWTNHMRT